MSGRHSFRRALAAGVALALVIGPVAPGWARTKESYAPTLPPDPPEKVADGAIFNVSTGYAGLVEGPRAHAVGDPLTIDLVENISTTKQAVGKTSKSGSFSVTPPSKGLLATLLNANTLNSSGSSSFSGQGDASENSTLAGSVAVTIAEVRRNGTALVKGEKRLKLSQGTEWVQLSGIVRLKDISQDNHIASTQVANAHIEYSGSGSIAGASRKGWLAKFFDIVNPF